MDENTPQEENSSVQQENPQDKNAVEIFYIKYPVIAWTVTILGVLGILTGIVKFGIDMYDRFKKQVPVITEGVATTKAPTTDESTSSTLPTTTRPTTTRTTTTTVTTTAVKPAFNKIYIWSFNFLMCRPGETS